MLNAEANIISIMVCFFFSPIHALNAIKPFETPSQNQRRTTKEFINISGNSLYEDKDTTFNRMLNTSITTPALLDDNEFQYEINVNNHIDSGNNQKAAPSISSKKLVKSTAPVPLAAIASTSSEFFKHAELQESLTHARNDKLILHRNKRYLLFPEGTSFQLVFDLIIPIVDYTNYAIMGITCAVAWELPSKPPSEIIENFHHKLNDGTFGVSRRNDSIQQQLKYINSQRTVQDKDENEDKQSNQQHPATVATTSAYETFITHKLKPQPPPLPSRNFYYNNIQYNGAHRLPAPPASSTSFFYNKHPQHKKWQNYNLGTVDNYQRKTFHGSYNGGAMHQHFTIINNNTRQHQQPKQTKLKYDNAGPFESKDNWWERNKNRIEQQWHEYQQKWSPYEKKQSFSTNQQNSHTSTMFSQRTGRNRKILKKLPKHRIYPVFGKRRKRSSSVYRNPPVLNTVVDNDEFSKTLKEIHTREHLHTRQKLYGKIEKLYKTRGHNGTACVLLALCETEKNHLNARHNETPQSFVMELLRSIFSLPKYTLTNAKDPLLHLDTRYIDAISSAHHDKSQSCSQKFNGCEYGISYNINI